MRTVDANHCFTVEDSRIVAIVEMEDEMIHTDEHSQCDDPTCPCNATTIEGSLADEHEAYLLECPQQSPSINHNYL